MTWEERMAERAAGRAVVREAENAARRALEPEPPPCACGDGWHASWGRGGVTVHHFPFCPSFDAGAAERAGLTVIDSGEGEDARRGSPP